MVQHDHALSRPEREAVDWLLRLQVAEHGDAAQAEFEAWRAADPENAKAFDAVERSISNTDLAAGSELVRTSRLHRASFFARKPVTSGALAAGLALLALVGGGVGLREAGYLDQPEATSQMLAFSTSVGEVRTATLDDGSRITLDAGTTLRVNYTADARLLQLDGGRTRFDVAHDPKRPFIVAAGDGKIIAHGTVFDVSVGPSRVRVVLLRGAIEVTKRDGQGGNGRDRGSRRLVPGQAVTFDGAHPIPEPDTAPPSELRWTSGMLSFDGIRLADAVAEFNCHSTRKIVLASPEIGDLRISGGFRAREAEKFAQVVAATFELRLLLQPTTLTLANDDEPSNAP